MSDLFDQKKGDKELQRIIGCDKKKKDNGSWRKARRNIKYKLF